MGIIPVILSGGAGTRLWPLSRGLRPKQFLALNGETSMFAETVARASGGAFAPPIIVCNDDHRFMVAEEMRQSGHAWQEIVLEPQARNTAPAIAIAALLAAEKNPNAVLAVLPSDHVIGDPDSFSTTVCAAAKIAADGYLVTFGVAPTHAATGYGYIQQGDPMAGGNHGFVISQFVEKPDAATAQRYFEAGGYCWNSGMFVFSATAYLKELGRHHEEIIIHCRSALDGADRDLDFLRLDSDAFGKAQSISIDYAVMEKTDHAVMIELQTSWSDIGSWAALAEMGTSDENGNVLVGDSLAVGGHGNYIRSEKPLIAAVGVDDLVIVATDDAVLVVPKDNAQDVRQIVDVLAQRGRDEVVTHSRVYRPWGYYQNLDGGEGFLVKQIVVKPGAKLSLQSHNHRAEHWVVVDGVARVTNGDDTFDLGANQSTYIPVNTRHRLENPGNDPLRLIEVQSGDYIGEDDIVRLEDTYGRA
ncbi:MAG: mannose-1-phosphate guanylyltransferase/mannose-6-phosphate isomerase [Rhodospirillaceae bacterium]|nr:mannose-1-phosphate guanylyltransferase/mannose-6-phosphate isomerase [Rhodospirillaceae bacterium]